MAPERRRQLLLGGLLIVLGVVLYAVWPRPAAPASIPSNTRGAARQAPGGEGITAPDVQLEALEADRPKPDALDRNLFRFRPAAAPPKPPAPAPTAPLEVAPAKPVAPPTPGVPPIPLRFIGVMKVDGRTWAVLRDDRGVYYGAEGAEIDGRYKILRVGEETIEMAYLDGRGRQTMRIAGQ